MKLLLDQGLPRLAASLLREAGIDAVHTGEIGYATAEDSDILIYARQEMRVIATLDSDFHALLARSNASSPTGTKSWIQVRWLLCNQGECAFTTCLFCVDIDSDCYPITIFTNLLGTTITLRTCLPLIHF